MSVDRGSSSIAWTIQNAVITSVAITATLFFSQVLAQTFPTQTLNTDWLNFRSTASVGQLAIFNSDPVATLQGATFVAKDRTGALITQGSLPPTKPGFAANTTFTLSGSGAVITINVPSTFNSCNLDPSLVVIPSSVTTPFPVAQFSRTTFERFFSIGGPIVCPR